MTSELMFKLTIVFLAAFVLSRITFNLMVDGMDMSEAMYITVNPKRVLKHPFIMAVSLTDRLTMLATIISALITAVLWLMGA